MTAGFECKDCKKYSSVVGRDDGEGNIYCCDCVENQENQEKQKIPVARKGNLPTKEDEKRIQEGIKKQQEAKKKILSNVHSMLRKMGKEKRQEWMQKFHDSIVITARNLRVRSRTPKYAQEQVETQIARKHGAVNYKGFWVQTYMGDMPILLKNLIDELCQQKDQK